MSTQQVIPPSTTANKPTPPPGTVIEGFGEIEKRAKHETASEVLAAQVTASIQARYVMALQRPRDFDRVRQRILKDCERPAFAAVARYNKPIGGTTVSGLSVAYARALKAHMGNMCTDEMITFDDPARRIVRVMTTDYETNNNESKDLIVEKTVERKQLRQGQVPLSSRTNSQGQRTYLVEATEDDTHTKVSAWAAKVERQNILALADPALQAECEAAIIATNKNQAAKDPEAEKRKIIDAFDDQGIRVEQLKAYLGVDDLGILTPKDLANLRGVYTAIKEGQTDWREVMAQREAARGEAAKAKGAPPSNRAAEVAAAMNKARTEAPASGPVAVHEPPAADPAPTVNPDAEDPSLDQLVSMCAKHGEYRGFECPNCKAEENGQTAEAQPKTHEPTRTPRGNKK